MGRLSPCPFFFGEDNMKNKTMYFIIAVCLMFLIISGCSNTENDNSVIIKVNGDDILLTDIDLARRQYSGRDVSDADLLGGLIKEKIVLQYFEKTGEQISDEEVESQYELLKTVENGNIFYEKALAEYGTDEKVKEAIKYRLGYHDPKEQIKVLAVKYVDESVPVNIFLGVSPDLYDLENGIKFSEKDGVNTVEISIADIGVKYIISSSIDKKLLEESLQEMIPYVLNS